MAAVAVMVGEAGSEVIEFRADGGGQSVVQLQVLEASFSYPSLRLSVSVDDDGFSGAYDGVWVEIDAFEQFVTALCECEASRTGSAELVSMSPDELSLRIEGVGRAGTFVLRYLLARYDYTSAGPERRSVSGAFDLDAEYLGTVAQSALHALAQGRTFLSRLETS